MTAFDATDTGYPSQRLTNVSTALPMDAAATTPGKKKTSLFGIF